MTKADDILNNTDPRELRNLLKRLKLNQAAYNRPVPNIVINQAPQQYPPSTGSTAPISGYDPNCVVITDEDGKITTDLDLEFVGVTNYAPGSQISTGTVLATNSSGVQITGLTIGAWYAIEGAGGPFHVQPSPLPYSGDYYNFHLKPDGGTFSGNVGYDNFPASMQLILPSFCSYAEAVDAHYGRVYFQATTTSVWFRVYDNNFPDNSGSLDYKLRAATVSEKQIQLYDVEYTKQKLPAAIHTATEKTTPSNGDEFAIWDSLTELLKKVTWANIKATLKTYFDTIYSALGHTHSYAANAFRTISVSGQSDIVADSSEDTLTLVAGENITITTDPTTDTITIASSSGSGTSQVIGVARWESSGSATFELPDIAEALLLASDQGAIVDPYTYSLSSDRTQIIFDSAITAAHIVTAEYILAQV